MESTADLKWRKSTYSSNGGGECVEVAAAHTVAVRDSENPVGPALAFTAENWTAFTRSLKDER